MSVTTEKNIGRGYLTGVTAIRHVIRLGVLAQDRKSVV